MQTQRFTFVSATLFGLIVAALGALAPVTPARGDVNHITAEPLTQRMAFTEDVSMRIEQRLEGLPEQVVELEDASHMAVVRFTIAPGAVFPWHTHPGTVLISIAEGELVFVFAADCVRRAYGAGSALVDPGDTVHTSFNPGTEKNTVVIATLLGVPSEGPLTIHVDDAEGRALDNKCDIDRDETGQRLAG